MKTYMITYDLHKPGQHYVSLYEEIKSLANGWWHSMNNVWFVNTSKNASQIRDQIARRLDQNDKVLVMEVGPDWASQNLPKDASDWFKTHAMYLAA